MPTIGIWIIIQLMISKMAGESFNQPKFSSLPTWNPNATTFASGYTTGNLIYSIFISTNNTVYVPLLGFWCVRIWLEGSIVPFRDISTSPRYPYSVFVTSNNDIYVNTGNSPCSVDKWTLNATNSISSMFVDDACFSLFVDVEDNLYCSLYNLHKVIKYSVNGSANPATTIAGTGNAGLSSNMLYGPRGIFVDRNLSLYVADCNNNRIQFFYFDQSSGVTIVNSTEVIGTTSLNYPSGITLDADGYLYITDCNNHRIVASGPNGFYCVVGCSGSGSTSYQLNQPSTLSFDSYGNLFVVDTNNERIQKFLLTTNLSGNILVFLDTILSEDIESTTAVMSIQQTSSSFLAPTCSNSITIGSYCNVTSTSCDILQPCQNNASCIDTNTTSNGYNCSCLSGFYGLQCQIDNRPCKSYTCWNNGICNETSKTEFICICSSDWQGSNCEIHMNYCQNVTCQNNGVCRSLTKNYTCECLSDSYSGRYCQIESNTLVLHQIVSKSFAFIAIIAMASVMMIVIVMDIMKYCFGIDAINKDLKRIRQRKKVRKHKTPIVIRFIYVN
ncbi:unnamed protein product [Adineta steineri]|uniref:EGF-like domain-containing protein n=1 Tax=Adineta steineri TaxID=433720 RepID=A0A814QT51_9BILA|nr:unnamed protein product [Adineta steineri]CAF1123921.1 unnamed protein product [Adineta steineri]